MGRKPGVHYVRYALWKGDQLLGIGTAKELAKKRGCKIETIRWHSTMPARARKGWQSAASGMVTARD